ncbi:MAG: hypothetical protein A4E49_00163 [Methanosaeta sp. PtaU1.Bin112]|nr:MAG: hypothetical protein A4E49_00163 [Methanosaeta sp. PtaU1.Bin112]
MSFDKEIRNALAKMVTACRRTLTEDVTNQLQETFGLYPDTSLPLDRLTHLTWDEAEAAQALREQLDHFAAVESGRPEERRRSAYDRLILEIAFTILNRLAALRLCEDRELVIECVRKGTASDGFRLFNSISGGALGSIHETYRIFLECMMDELALDLGVLFDRTNPQSAVFPTERCLKEIFNLLNDPDLSFVWSEDETIGWIYQYFNPPEERRAMREASQAPRNSRELAVRNQFFTPRYVVEFLTDNTLGRIWYEMRKRKTSLVEQCRYLVRRPNEIFLDLGEEPVEDDHEKDFSQEELLKRPCYILHRPKKDPRDIKSLDPACGSAHFLLYDFDLMETIYVEAWNDPESPASEATGRTLLEDYPTLDVLRRALPELILRHNLHGIDIDVRAVQIAAFALWLRAQRSWKAQEIKAKDRPRVTKSNIICAEPMPGENDMLREFTESIQPELLGQLVEKIFEKMKMAGEAGSLLKIEEDIHEAVTDANRRWIQGIKQTMQTQLKSDQEYIKPSHRPSPRARVGEDFWDVAENHIIEALREYAENAENGKTLSRRLFTDDAASGFALIDLFRKRFDVLLMNPPFGEYPETFKALSKIQYNSGGHDILTAFIERGLATCAKNGLLGAITSRTVFFMPTTKEWRKKIILQRQNLLWIELGEGVLDEAMVETCVYVVQNSSPYLPCLFINPSSIPLDQIISGFNLHNFIENVIYYLDQRKFETIEGSPLAYWIAPKMLECYNKLPSLEDKGINVRVGLQTGDDFRFIRCWWEIPIGLETWIPHSKGGENLPYATDIHLVINWKNNGNEMRAQESIRLNMYAKHDPCEGLDPGLTFSYRTHRFSPAIMPSGVIAGVAGMGVFSEKFELFLLLALLNTSVVNEFIETRLGLQKTTHESAIHTRNMKAVETQRSSWYGQCRPRFFLGRSIPIKNWPTFHVHPNASLEREW